MASIPLPATQIQPPPSTLDEFTRAAQLRGMVQNQQLQGQEITLRNQQIQDQNALTQAMKDWDPSKGYDDLKQKALQYGASGNAALQIDQHAIQLQTQRETLTKDQLENAKNKNQTIADRIQGAESLPDDKLAGGLHAAITSLQNDGYLNPNDANTLHFGVQNNLNDPAALRQHMMEFTKVHQGASVALSQEKTTAETQQAQAKTRLDNAQAIGKEIENKSLQGITPDYINSTINSLYPNSKDPVESQQRTMVGQQALNMLVRGDITGARDFLKQASDKALAERSDIAVKTNPSVLNAEAALKAIEARETLRIQAQGVAGIQLTPAQINTVHAINEGRETPPSGYALSTPYWQAIMGGVTTLDPQWSEQRAQLRKGYTQDKEIGAINTGLGHVGVLNNAIDALNNNDVLAINKIANYLHVQIGDDPVTTFKTIVHRVGPELSKAYIAGGGSAGERGADEKDFSSDLSPTQLKENVAETAHLLSSKIASKAYQWDVNKSDSMPAFNDRFIMPAAKEVLNKLSPNWQNENKPGGAITGPPPPSQQGKQPVELTAGQITAYANAHKVSEDEVKRQAKAKGIKVPD